MRKFRLGLVLVALAMFLGACGSLISYDQIKRADDGTIVITGADMGNGVGLILECYEAGEVLSCTEVEMNDVVGIF